MRIKADERPGRGTYRCTNCNQIVNINSDDHTLRKCNSCSCEEFEPIIFRTKQGIQDKLHEVLTVLGISVFLFEEFEIEAFSNVIALQLRMLLCDSYMKKDISLLPWIYRNIKFHPCIDEYITVVGDNKFISPVNLFDYNQSPISLKMWLRQEILYINDKEKAITIKDFIKTSANKNGGAHLQSYLSYFDLFAAKLAKNYLLQISKYIFELTNYDYSKDSLSKILVPACALKERIENQA